MRTLHEAKRINQPTFVRLSAPPNPRTRNYIKVTLYGPEPSTGRRAIVDERWLFFNDQSHAEVQKAREQARQHADLWRRDLADDGYRVSVSIYDLQEFPAVATLADREVKPIWIRICRVFGCYLPATAGGICHAGHNGIRRRYDEQENAA